MLSHIKLKGFVAPLILASAGRVVSLRPSFKTSAATGDGFLFGLGRIGLKKVMSSVFFFLTKMGPLSVFCLAFGEMGSYNAIMVPALFFWGWVRRSSKSRLNIA